MTQSPETKSLETRLRKYLELTDHDMGGHSDEVGSNAAELIDEAANFIRDHVTAPPQSVPEGWRLVPEILTQEMIYASANPKLDLSASDWERQAQELWTAMLNAAPSASPTPQPVGGGDGLAEALEKFNKRDPEDAPPWPQDSDLEGVWQEGVSWALLQVGKFLGIKNWDADGASESVEGDVAHEIGSIFATAKLYDPENGAWATLAPAPDVVDLDALEKFAAELQRRKRDYQACGYVELLPALSALIRETEEKIAVLRQSTATKGPNDG